MIGKRITFCFYAFYPSNLSYCHLLSGLIDGALAEGYKVDVVTYSKKKEELRQIKERFNNYDVEFHFLRNFFKNKAIVYVYFSLRAFFWLLFHAKGSVVVPSTPPVLMGLSVALAKKLSGNRFQFIYHVQDIHPEISAISDGNHSTLLTKFLLSLDNFTLRTCDYMVTLSNDMADTIKLRCPMVSDKICVVNNFHVASSSHKSKNNNIEIELSNDTVNFVYAGNVGRYQNLESVVVGFCNEPFVRARLYILGDGERLHAVKDVVNKSNCGDKVVFLGKVDLVSAQHIVSQCDYGVVSLLPGVLKYAYPSKIISYLCGGIPLLAIIDTDSEVATLIRDCKLGVIADPASIKSISDSVNTAIKEKDKHDRKEISEIGIELFGKERLIHSFFECVK